MRSSDRRAALAVAIAMLMTAAPSRARAQVQAQGFAVERFTPSAPGGGWFVMDALDLRGGLGGAMGMVVGYSHNPLRVRSEDGAEHLTVVSNQAFANFGFAATYDRFRLYLDLALPLVVKGNSGTLGGMTFTAPTVDPGSNPDTLSDARIGFDGRLIGTASSAFRLGAGAQLLVPNGNRSDYVTDHTYRAMGRVLFAGDVGHFTYAGHLGAHLRPLDDSTTQGSPRGSELLFGVAAGSRFFVCGGCRTALVVGPEIYGATAFRSSFTTNATALEGLLTGRLEGSADDGPQLRVKLGIGAGFNAHFGAPEARLLFGLEVFDHAAK